MKTHSILITKVIGKLFQQNLLVKNLEKILFFEKFTFWPHFQIVSEVEEKLH